MIEFIKTTVLITVLTIFCMMIWSVISNLSFGGVLLFLLTVVAIFYLVIWIKSYI